MAKNNDSTKKRYQIPLSVDEETYREIERFKMEFNYRHGTNLSIPKFVLTLVADFKRKNT